MIEKTRSIIQEFNDFEAIEYSYALGNGQEVAILEQYPEYYSVYWEIDINISEFIKAVVEMVDASKMANNGIGINGFAAGFADEVHEVAHPLSIDVLGSIPIVFPAANFLRIDTNIFDAWAMAPIHDTGLGSLGSKSIGGIISRYNLSSEISMLHGRTNAAGKKLSSNDQQILHDEFYEYLKEVLNRYSNYN